MSEMGKFEEQKGPRWKYNICPLEGMGAYGPLLLAPVESWWPMAT